MRFSLASLLWLTLALVPCAARPAPNIIVIIADDLSQNAVSAYGSNIWTRVAPTTEIDRIAAAGVVFSNSFVTNSLCSPSRATLLTGKYSSSNGVFLNTDVFDGTQQTMPKLLDSAGYQTAIIGKWMLGSTPTGFDYFDIISPFTGQGNYQNPRMAVCDACGDAGTVTNRTGYATTLFTTYAIDWITANKSDAGPFALFISHKATHSEWVPMSDHAELYATDFAHPATYDDDLSGRSAASRFNTTTLYPNLYDAWHSPTFVARGKGALSKGADAERKESIYQAYVKDYLRTLKSLDMGVGSILDYLAANNDENGVLSTNTVVIFVSDNGMLLGEHGRHGKSEMFEESIRVPFLMSGPGIPSGTSVSQMVTNVDWAATILDLANMAIPSDMQGRSVLALLDGSPPADWRTSFYYQNYRRQPIRNVVPSYGIRTSRYKLMNFYGQGWGGSPEWELIDLESDPGEVRNVYPNERYADVVTQLKAQLMSWQTELGIAPIVAGCPGDMNRDGAISLEDVFSVLRCRGLPLVGGCTPGDLDGDGSVTTSDLIQTARAYGRRCTP